MNRKLISALSVSALLLFACDDIDSDAEEDVELAEDEAENDTEDVSKDEEEESVGAEEDEENEESVEDTENGLLSIGDSVTIDDITMTITHAEFTDDRNQFEESDPENVIAVHYTLHNDSDDDYPYGMDFDVYVDGSQSDSYPNENSMGSVSSGRSVDGVEHFSVEGDTIEVEWAPMFSFSGDKGIWDITP